MFENDELTAWLESCVQSLYERDKESKITSAAIVTLSEDRLVLTGYYNCDATDKALFAHNINADAMLDVVLNNIDTVRDALEDLNEEEQKCD